MKATQKFPVVILSPDIRHASRVTVHVEDVSTMADAMKIAREWAEDVATWEDLRPEVTATAFKAMEVTASVQHHD